MTDKNNVEIKAGDIVEITGAYFKHDNALYFVEHIPGDPGWIGGDICLHMIGKSGKLSSAKYATAFWPLKAYVSNRVKAARPASGTRSTPRSRFAPTSTRASLLSGSARRLTTCP